MSYENLLYDVSEGVATITINRPRVLNALNFQTRDELVAAFEAAHGDEEVRAVILTGAGEKAFIAGADVSEIFDVVSGESVAGRDGIPFTVRPLMDLLWGSAKPVIAAVNGFCLGGGCELLYACTLAYAAESAKFGQPEVNLGFNPCWGATQQLPRLAGTKKAMELVLLGDMFDAREAFRLGIVNAVVPDGELMATVREVAEKLATKPPLAVRLIMECVRSAGDLTLRQGLDLEASLFAMLCGTEDIKEGTKAFLEKRQAHFRGR